VSGRLFSLLPAVYRLRDHAQGDPLRALLAIIEGEVVRVERDIDQLYDNWFIETCDTWVVPYIGDLLGARGLLAGKTGTFSQRGYVANTLAYRRRKGTAAVLEQLARDLTGWPARAVEFFARLATTQHVNHVRREASATVDVRRAAALEQSGTPFETAMHTAEVRHIDNGRGTYNIPCVGLFLWRLQSYLLTGVTPHPVDARRFTFDPTGRATALFDVPATETALGHLAEPFNVPIPLSRRALDRDLARYYGTPDAVSSVRIHVGPAVQPIGQIVVCDLSDAGGGQWAHDAPTGKIALDPQLGRIVFGDTPAAGVSVDFAHGFGGDLGGGPYDGRAAIADVMKGGTTWQVGVMRDPPPAQTQIKATLADAVAEWNQQPAGSRGVIVLMDSRTHEENLDTAGTRINVPADSQLLIVAGQWPEEETRDPLRPLARLAGRVAPKEVRPHLKGAIEVAGTAPATSPTPGRLFLDGVLLEGTLRVVAGHLRELAVSHSTLLPHVTTFTCQANPDLTLTFSRTVCGDLKPGASAHALALVDAIVDGDVEAHALTVDSSTILGTTTAHTLEASNAICVGRVQVERQQVGCVRFSYVTLDSQPPRRFHCQPTSATAVVPQFVSTTFGDPAYAVLAPACPPEIASGADDEGEMGAWHFLQAPQRVRSLRLALDEYLRFGLEAGIFFAPQ